MPDEFPFPQPPDYSARDERRNKVMLGIMITLAIAFAVIVLDIEVLPNVAPPPVQFRNTPAPVAANPNDPDHWDFTNNDPTFYPGDAIVVEVIACVIDPFGGPSVHWSGHRKLISVNGLITDTFDSADAIIPVRPCAVSHANVGVIAATTPPGRYRVESSVTGSTALYTRDSSWYTIWFEVQNP